MTILVTIQAQLVVGEEQVIKSLAPGLRLSHSWRKKFPSSQPVKFAQPVFPHCH